MWNRWVRFEHIRTKTNDFRMVIYSISHTPNLWDFLTPYTFWENITHRFQYCGTDEWDFLRTESFSFILVTEPVLLEPKYTEAEKDEIIAEQSSEITRLEQKLIRIRRLNAEKRKHLIDKPMAHENEETAKVRILDRRSKSVRESLRAFSRLQTTYNQL